MKNIAIIGLRLLAIYFWGIAVGAISQTGLWLFMRIPGKESMFYFIPIIGYTIFGLIIWFFSNRISNKMIIDRDINIKNDMNTNSIYSLAFIILGILLLSRVIPSIAGYFQNLFIDTSDVPHEMIYMIKNNNRNLSLVIPIKIIIAILLIFFAPQLSNFFIKMNKYTNRS